MSVIVANLMKMGLVDRRGHEVHGRIQTLELTARGTQVLRDAKARVYDLENAMLVACRERMKQSSGAGWSASLHPTLE